MLSCMHAHAVSSCTAAELLANEHTLGVYVIPTLASALDEMMGGGVACGQVTEFCGVPGVGKTQIGCVLLALVFSHHACHLLLLWYMQSTHDILHACVTVVNMVCRHALVAAPSLGALVMLCAGCSSLSTYKYQQCLVVWVGQPCTSVRGMCCCCSGPCLELPMRLLVLLLPLHVVLSCCRRYAPASLHYLVCRLPGAGQCLPHAVV